MSPESTTPQGTGGPDALTLIANETRRRGLPSHGAVHADIWERVRSWAHYDHDGHLRAQQLPLTEAISSLPDQAWRDVATASSPTVAALLESAHPSGTATTAQPHSAASPAIDAPAGTPTLAVECPADDLGL